MRKVNNETQFLEHIIHFHEDTIEKLDKTVTRVVKLLTLSNKSIATAESCTGGLLSQLITSVSGASQVFELGVCSYSNRIKNQVLGVPFEIIDKYTEVSQQTAILMAEGIQKISGADICVSVTGIAGPGGGTEKNPVGTVYTGFIYNDIKFVRLLKMTGTEYDREAIRMHTALNIFEVVEKLLTGDVHYE